ncbi:hypothetical protein FHS85_001887 [Rhodoligotrophos appendicifer]|uniref:baseplate megatron protein TIM-barrel domain-containing protein n=1 Tax=Rhodoligotrophos appendicifer TaxID=987056 RepID=UPI001FEB977E|nr:glycoside hydrolase TIM-barrel-like domain-containing protein [Rhodoligotrophos appendicifer]
MASLLLTTAASALGSSMGLSTIGTTLLQVGAAVAGSAIDNALFGGGSGSTQVGPRLTELDVLSATEGAPIPRAYGRVRVGGQMIWATRLEEVIDKDTTESGGFLFIDGATSTRITYRYYANFAVALCEGEIAAVNRMWADGKEVGLGGFSFRIHKGDDAQLPDALIEAKEGAGRAPAYRGTAYIVFERMPLEAFGNRIPQLNFEVFKVLPGRVEERIRAVNLIPGATEFGYEPDTVKQVTQGSWGTIAVGTENAHLVQAGSDWEVTLEHLAALLPNLAAVNLVVAWFGDDLRCADCSIRPKVDNGEKETIPLSWRVAGLTREEAEVVTLVAERPAFGGTPNDASVVRAVGALKERGYHVTVLPFLMMDIAADNGLSDPYSGASSQPAYPWRGRITADPAPGRQNFLPTTETLSAWSKSSVTVTPEAGDTPAGVSSDLLVLQDASTSAGGFASSAVSALIGKRATVSVYVKRDAAAVAFPALRVFTRLSTHAVTLRYNPVTDQVNALTSGAGLTRHGSGMETEGDFRRLWIDLEDPAGTAFRVDLFPAFGAVGSFPTAANSAVGTARFVGPQATLRHGLSTFFPNSGTGALAADKTAAAATQVDAFLGTAAAADFSFDAEDERVDYSGPAEWSYRRFILHYAALAQGANADAFLIGSEMVGLTQLRDGAGSYPFVAGLQALAEEARTLLGEDVEISYAADWSEYHSHRPDDGTGDVHFHLDPLWAHGDIDFVGIDNYLPLSDWREGQDHVDFDPDLGHVTIYAQDYLQGQIEGGEHYDWFFSLDP